MTSPTAEQLAEKLQALDRENERLREENERLRAELSKDSVVLCGVKWSVPTHPPTSEGDEHG